MGQQLPENMRVLRFFGAEKSAIEMLVRQSKNKPDLKIQSMERGSETLVIIETSRVSASSIRAILTGWEEQFAARCGGAFYGAGDISLIDASLAAMDEKEVLFACAEAQTGALVREKLSEYERAQRVFDFGANSYEHRKYAKKIAEGSSFAKKYPSNSAQQVAGKLKVCYKYSGADYVVAFLPLGEGEHLVMLGDKKGYWIRKIDASEKPVLWLIDMLRRATLGLPQVKGTRYYKYGARLPEHLCANTADLSDEERLQSESFAQEPVADSEDDVFERAPKAPPVSRNSGLRFVLAVILVAIFAIAIVGALYVYTGGDLASLWNHAGLPDFSVSSASYM